jgi:gluconate 2-dehydrogenase gamma chain
MTPEKTSEQGRRGFLKQVAMAAAVAPLGSNLMAAAATEGSAPDPAPSATGAAVPAPAAGYASLGPDEAGFLEAMLNVMCPADQLTPNGVDCGLAVFIDRQLAGDFGRGARLYRQGPWPAGRPELGYQLPLTPEQYFKAGIAAAGETCRKARGKRFEELAPAEADAFLQDLAADKFNDGPLALGAWFNGLVYPLFEQACFADPLYGGNNGKVFWKMIGYPGLPATHANDMVEFRGKPYPGARDPKSIADFS